MRRREAVARRRRRLAVGAAAVVLAAAGAIGATYTPLFGADAIHVRGVERLGPDEVARIAGLDLGMNVFHLDAGAVEAVLEEDPRIASARVSRDLPGAVVVTVRERVPVAVVSVDGRTTAVASDGTLLPGVAAPSMPEIQASVGSLEPATRTAAARALAALAPSIRRRVEWAQVALTGDLLLAVRDGPIVRYGEPAEAQEEAAAKAAALEAVLAWAAQRDLGLASIDVSTPGAPTARPTGSAERPV